MFARNVFDFDSHMVILCLGNKTVFVLFLNLFLNEIVNMSSNSHWVGATINYGVRFTWLDWTWIDIIVYWLLPEVCTVFTLEANWFQFYQGAYDVTNIMK